MEHLPRPQEINSPELISIKQISNLLHILQSETEGNIQDESLPLIIPLSL